MGGGSGDAGAGLWLRPRQLGTAPVSALLLARRAEGCTAAEPERRSPSQRPRVPHSPRPFPAARARAHTHSASPKHKQRGRADRERSPAPKLCSPLIDPLLSSRGLPLAPGMSPTAPPPPGPFGPLLPTPARPGCRGRRLAAPDANHAGLGRTVGGRLWEPRESEALRRGGFFFFFFLFGQLLAGVRAITAKGCRRIDGSEVRFADK